MLNKIKSRLSSGKKQNHYLFFLKGIFVSIILTHLLIAQTISVSGLVTNEETGKPIVGANIVSGDVGTTTDKDGQFSLTIPEKSKITISFIGFKSVTISPSREFITVRLTPTVIKGEEVYVLANRAVAGVTPVAFSTLTSEEINVHYTVEDVPMVLASEPGVYAYSESGNGTGYSYVSIRGFDQSRIAVMLDNVPLNDNESHQVYWVDHGDILSDAQDVQIQRGIGNSLYGSAAFGGSINIITDIAQDEKEVSAAIGAGSYNTKKYRIKFNSGKLFGENLSLTSRISQIESDGYRDFHESIQRAGFFGIEHRTGAMINQFRAQLGYENTNLLWDGVPASDINDREKRRAGYKSYTDDFFQQIYSLNTRYQFSDDVIFHNVAYLVKGAGYYEVYKNNCDFYSYNLDVDTSEYWLETDLLRRKWIVNSYFGIVPTWTLRKEPFRIDIGGELRWYRGDHFGEVTDFSNPIIQERFGSDWYKYYEYFGKKRSISGFAHLMYAFPNRLKLILDLQYQENDWNLDQKKIGHAVGHNLSALWQFLNPRFGLVYSVNKQLSIFLNYGKAQKEPADDQIIEADDVWSTPVIAAAEVVSNLETGWALDLGNILINLNAYRILYNNEQLKNIDVKQEGEYDYYKADSTVHQGFEYELDFHLSSNLRFQLNGMFNNHHFSSGINKGKKLTNIPDALVNVGLNWQVFKEANISANWKYVGTQYLDNDNYGKIAPYSVLDFYLSYRWKDIKATLKVNNVFDTLYSTYGYGYEWEGYWAYYWPGATRNVFVSLEYQL
ncbi:MAG: TonB-dependent receptor [Candidatus Marinimicrobia bacterium]|nr:TonB-dependent receptor [Candidatus Neomarinimicrobiota bacterium]